MGSWIPPSALVLDGGTGNCDPTLAVIVLAVKNRLMMILMTMMVMVVLMTMMMVVLMLGMVLMLLIVFDNFSDGNHG